MPDIQEFLLHYAGKPRELIEALSVETSEERANNYSNYKAEYNGERMRRADSIGKLPPKLVPKYSNDRDELGRPKIEGFQEKAAIKIATNFPKKAVRTEVAFLFCGSMRVESTTTDDAYKTFVDVWEQTLGMQDILIEFAEKVLSETKAAIIFYPVPNIRTGKSEINCRVLSLPKKKDALNAFFPNFDKNGRLDAFLYRYHVKDIEGRTREEAKLWTAGKVYTIREAGGSWTMEEEENLFKLIPVVYAEVDAPTWEDIAPAMDAFEKRVSKVAETNDYFADPMLIIKGDIDPPPSGQEGHVMIFPHGESGSGTPITGDAKYLSWNQEIGSTSKELEILQREMHGGISVPDLSFESLRGIGNLSGVARRFMLLETEIKREFNQRTFRPALKRCITVVKAGISNIVDIRLQKAMEEARYTVRFDSILPRDPSEDAHVLAIAGGGKAFNSLQTIVGRSPLTPQGDIEGELERLKEESEAERAAENLIGATVPE